MDSSSPENIFDPALQKVKKKTKETPHAPIMSTEKRRELIMKDPEVKEWITRIEELNRSLKEKIGDLIEKHGFTPRSVKGYLNNPKNFTPDQWNLIQKQRVEIEKMVGIALDPVLRKEQKKAEAKVRDKERKGKTLGSRKNWMPMR